jgi:selenide, water dikinase
MNASLAGRELVLLGPGHTNAHVLRMWRMSPIAHVRLTCVSDFPIATYSGMLPGTLAGIYQPERMRIDLVRLCAAAGARLLVAEATGLDLARRELMLQDRPPVTFDALSIGIGSVPQGSLGTQADEVLPIKPMQNFIARLDKRLAVVRRSATERTIELAVVGAGAGGVEIAFCLPGHLEWHWPELRYRIALIDSGDEILPGANNKAISLARRELARRGVELLLERRVSDVTDGQLRFADGTTRSVDVAIWATGAAAPPLLAKLGLPLDDRGFLLTRPSLDSLADARVFAVGDCGVCLERPHPKAGVHAVRQGPVLWDNVRRLFAGQPLTDYRPQRRFLSLMATGDRRAILSRGGFAFHAAWCWKLKDYIDGRFMDKYQDYRPMVAASGMHGRDSAAARPASASRLRTIGRRRSRSAEPPARPAMRCAGCGSKVGGAILSRVLARLNVPRSEHVLLGLESPDDAAIVRPVEGRPLVTTVDFFTAFADDAYLVGRVAALNAMSDLFALGARPLAAMAIVSVPQAPARQQEQLLHELLAGGLSELVAAGATLVGGHTIEAAETTIGFSLLGDAGVEPPSLKRGLRAGDRLVLTKPLGTGILLAAQMRAQCRAEWWQSLVASLVSSNQSAAEVARRHSASAVTDVTGFGLAGHLLEMLRASDMAAEIDLSAIPLLPGVSQLLAAGIESTLAPANREVEAEIENRRSVAPILRGGEPSVAPNAAAYAALFDPQTSGGLLIGVDEARLPSLLAELNERGRDVSSVIGQAVPHTSDRPRMRLRYFAD